MLYTAESAHGSVRCTGHSPRTECGITVRGFRCSQRFSQRCRRKSAFQRRRMAATRSGTRLQIHGEPSAPVPEGVRCMRPYRPDHLPLRGIHQRPARHHHCRYRLVTVCYRADERLRRGIFADIHLPVAQPGPSQVLLLAHPVPFPPPISRIRIPSSESTARQPQARRSARRGVTGPPEVTWGRARGACRCRPAPGPPGWRGIAGAAGGGVAVTGRLRRRSCARCSPVADGRSRRTSGRPRARAGR